MENVTRVNVQKGLAMFTDPQMAHATHSSLLVSGKRVRMKTTVGDTVNLNTSKVQSNRLLLDCGSQRIYISEDLVNIYIPVAWCPNKTEMLTVFKFGSTKPKEFKTTVVAFGLKVENRQMRNIQANVVQRSLERFRSYLLQ